MPSCPECNSSERVVLAGNRYVHGQKIQRYLCKICGYRFSEKNVLSETRQSGVRQILVLDKEMQNLTAKQQKEVLQGNGENKTNLFNYSWYLQKLGKNESTIITYTKRLQSLLRYCNLSDPEEVKGIIATKYRTNATKQVTTYAYDAYLQFIGKTWTKPNYKPEHKTVFIPTEAELELAINSGEIQSVIFSKLANQSGGRVNELEALTWADINEEKSVLTLKASKNGKSRRVRVTPELITLLKNLPKKQETIFPKVTSSARSNAFRNRMKSLARRLDNPRFMKFHLHTFRHCKALREYHRTKDVLYVKKLLGHRSIETTMRYVDIYTDIYGENSSREFVTKIASTKQERIELINQNWELVEKDGIDWYFRKAK